jgi:hypothetical protein
MKNYHVTVAIQVLKVNKIEDEDEAIARESRSEVEPIHTNGDEPFEQPQTIEVEGERLRKAAPELLKALSSIRAALQHHRHWTDSMPGHLLTIADNAIAKVTGKSPTDP